MDLTETDTGRLMKQRKRSSIVCIVHRTLVGLSNRGRWVGQEMYVAYTCERNEKCIYYFCSSPDGKKRLGRLGVDGMIILKWISK